MQTRPPSQDGTTSVTYSAHRQPCQPTQDKATYTTHPLARQPSQNGAMSIIYGENAEACPPFQDGNITYGTPAEACPTSQGEASHTRITYSRSNSNPGEITIKINTCPTRDDRKDVQDHCMAGTQVSKESKSLLGTKKLTRSNTTKDSDNLYDYINPSYDEEECTIGVEPSENISNAGYLEPIPGFDAPSPPVQNQVRYVKK